MARFDLISPAYEKKDTGEKSSSYAHQLSDVIFKKNIVWFIELRLIVIAVLVIFGFCSILFSGYLTKIGISAPIYWSFIIAVILLIADFGFWVHVNIDSKGKAASPTANIWFQIIIDLIALTTVVYFSGSTRTPVAFLYVIHISLSCIFFDWKSSLTVTLSASILYFGCVLLEYLGVIPYTGVLKTDRTFFSWHSLIWAAAVIAIFFVVWFIVSRLSFIIRMREKQLISIQEDLKNIQKTKDQYAIQMTHQLKSPLDAIRSTIMLISEGYYGEVNKELLSVMKRIEIRAKAMGDLILDVLRLARLFNPGENKGAVERINLGDFLAKIISGFKTTAEPRDIGFETDIAPAFFSAVPEQMQIFFTNLISNAVNYSYDGGIVSVKCYTGENAPVIIISDNGIGIREDKLPNIFNEYFKTKEAMKHNPASTGIGLSMVRRIAEVYKIKISVESEFEKGTSFTLRFPVK